MTPAEMAALMARAYVHGEVPWSADQVALTAEADNSIVVESAAGFALGWVVADEAELLAIAVEPGEQGNGHGNALLSHFLDCCAAGGAVAVFLEASAANDRALRFYEGHGFRKVGSRSGYYRTTAGTVAALLLRKDFDAAT